MYQGQYIKIPNFKGGYCGNLPADKLALNQAADLDNIVILPDGGSWRTRLGSTSPAAAFSFSVDSLGYLKTSAGGEYLLVVEGTKFYASGSGDFTTFSDKTGAVTITSNVVNTRTFITFNDVAIAFGGDSTSPDAPFKWTGSGNAAALGGSPPSAYGCFTANNRVFAFRTSANPSTIYWSIVANAEDWTSAGSGSATVGTLNDNQKVTAAAVLNTNTALIFKENSVYQMILTSAPFPIYSLFNTVGCIGKNAVCTVDGKVYFVTSQLQLRATDGATVEEFPRTADDVFTNTDGRLIKLFRQKGTDYDWLVITSATAPGSAPGTALIWDLINKCWLKCSTGYAYMYSQAVTTSAGVNYGSSGTVVVQLSAPATYTDYFLGTPTAVSSFWRSGWISSGEIDNTIHPNRLLLQIKTKASGSVSVSYGFDFVQDQKSFTLSQTPTTTESITFKTKFLSGRGNVFQYKLSQSSGTIDSQVNGVLIGGKAAGQKRIAAT